MSRMICRYNRVYEVDVVEGLLAPRDPCLARALGGRRAVVVTTRTVESLLGPALRAYVRQHGLDAVIVVLDLNEQAKTLETAIGICDRALEVGLGRRDVLVALGGGVCSDVVAFAASLLRRGTPHIRLPTTLVGQVDAGIGLKCGVNHGGRKNVLGAFQPPEHVLMDTAWLRTLPPVEVSCGIAEMLKIALVADAGLYAALAGIGMRPGTETGCRAAGPAVVKRAIELMLEQLGADCFEDGSLQRPVDFGHTFSGHLEEISAHTLRHGEAVAIDMCFTLALGCALGVTSPLDAAEVLAVMARHGLPTWSPLLDEAAVVAAARATTAHRGGRLNLVVPTAPGSTVFLDNEDITSAAVREALDVVRNPRQLVRRPECVPSSPAAGAADSATSRRSAS